MRCSVQNCYNDTRRNNNSHGITFHSFPKQLSQWNAWVEALGMSDWEPKEWGAVCSEHFRNEDFYTTRGGLRRIKCGAVPFAMTEALGDLDAPASLRVCRICLVMDTKMYHIRENKLDQMYEHITGLVVCDETERELHRVCWECAARLTAASKFRDKALLTDTLLKDLVHRNRRNIKKLRQCYSNLKSSLTVQIAFTSADIECGDFPIELHRDKTENRKVYKMKTKLKSNGEKETTVFDEEEPLIEFPVKTEIESDPFDENNINIKIEDKNSVIFSEVTHLDDSFMPSKDGNDDGVSNTDGNINEKIIDTEMMAAPIKYGSALVEDSAEKQPTIDAIDNVSDEGEDTEMTIKPNNDSDIVLEEENEKKNPVLDGISNVSDVASSEEDGQSLAELASVKKTKKQTSRKVGASNKRLYSKRSTHRNIDETTRAQIIALHNQGVNLSEIARETGVNRNTVGLWVKRFKEEGNLKTRARSGRPPLINKSQRRLMTREYETNAFLPIKRFADKFATSLQTVRRALHAEGLHHHIPVKKTKGCTPGVPAEVKT